MLITVINSFCTRHRLETLRVKLHSAAIHTGLREDPHRAARTVSPTNYGSVRGITATSSFVFHYYSLHVQGIQLFQILYELDSIYRKRALEKPLVNVPRADKQTAFNSSPLHFEQKGKLGGCAYCLASIHGNFSS